MGAPPTFLPQYKAWFSNTWLHLTLHWSTHLVTDTLNKPEIKIWSTHMHQTLPTVRSQRSQATSKKKKKKKHGTSEKPPRISSYDFQSWDKFDVVIIFHSNCQLSSGYTISFCNIGEGMWRSRVWSSKLFRKWGGGGRWSFGGGEEKTGGLVGEREGTVDCFGY